VLKAELAKLEFLRGHGADRLDLSALPAGRRRMLDLPGSACCRASAEQATKDGGPDAERGVRRGDRGRVALGELATEGRGLRTATDYDEHLDNWLT